MISLVITLVAIWSAVFVFLLIIWKKGLIKHRINYRDIEGTQPQTDVYFPIPVSFSEADYVYRKNSWGDVWILNVGQVLESILKVAVSKATKHSDEMITIKNLEVTRFIVGYWIWSKRSITVSFSFEISSNGNTLKSGTIEETCSGKNSDLGKDKLIPGIAQLKGVGMSIGLALSRTLQQGLSTLRKEIEPFIT